MPTSPTYTTVDASPVKSFFVSMLTRDITLEDAILDLLDNCVDGILRQKPDKGNEPYTGYKATIDFNRDTFTISDNCGGIPWSLHEYAFRMGRVNRPTDTKGTVGVYGIGLKRAIFKMGRECLISTQNGAHRYELEITSSWLKNEENWEIPVRAAAKAQKQDGTTIVIGDLYDGIAARFSEDAQAFKADLDRMIATHYAFIIDKGFSVKLNGTTVKPRPTKLLYAKRPQKNAATVQPFLFKTKSDGVSVFLAVGFTRPIPSMEEASSGDCRQQPRQTVCLEA